MHVDARGADGNSLFEHTRHEAENSTLNSTFGPQQKWEHYHVVEDNKRRLVAYVVKTGDATGQEVSDVWGALTKF